MEIRKGNDPIILLIGDVFFWTLALWLSLFARYLEAPSTDSFLSHLYPFLFIFFCWAVIFFILDLYSTFTGFFRAQLATTIFRAQIANSIFAVLFFYFFPGFGISPKTILLIDLAVSFVLIFVWRFLFVPIAFGTKRERALLLGHGEEIEETKKELQKTPYFFELITPSEEISLGDIKTLEKFIDEADIGVVLTNFRDKDVEKRAARLYNTLFTKVRFISLERIYEELFGRVPLALVSDGWILENISYRAKRGYAVLKRAMDVSIGLVLAFVSLLAYPFVYIAIKFDDGGKMFSIQTRVGQNNRLIRIFKFRTMTVANDGGVWNQLNKNEITRVGGFLRKTRIDELPQLWNVVFGDISLVGPRPEFAPAVERYEKEIPYYSIRHLIKPGLSGWAQIMHNEHPHHGVVLPATEEKLSYDIYYIKNRSFILDLKIALKTIRTLFSRKGI